jgi:uncharacterized protein (DUF305 family)
MKTSLVAAVAFALAAPAVALAQSSSDSKAGAGASTQMHEHMMQGSRQSMQMKPSGNVDRDFATMMRQHHQMGMRMAQEEVKSGQDPKMKELAQKILDSQKQEVKEFDQWLESHSGQTSGQAGHGSSGGQRESGPSSAK